MRRALALGAMVMGALAAYGRVVKPRLERWGATDDEVAANLPGDELLAEPAAQVTRAITIEADPEDVWPWIVQLGADRAGFYSYDWMENLFGLGIHSADRVVESWQDLRVGEVVFANRARSGGWYVVDVRPGEALVLQVGDLNAGRPLRRDEQLRFEFQWTFVLRQLGPGATRFVVRERTAFGSRLTRRLAAPVSLVSFVMTRRMMLGIKTLAERPARLGDVVRDGR
ncbi:MAG TPA: hypothetical protein VFJ85_03745 [Acidimicrobiales bacterium]|nr:hypothetical protein [Acidimicrobiales bacterium]